MAMELERLVLRLEGDSAKLQAELSAAQKQITALQGASSAASTRMASDLKRTADAGEGLAAGFAKLRGVFATLGIGIGLGELVRFTAEAIHSADELLTLSKRIGISAEAFQSYQYAAKLANLETGQFTTGLEFFVKTLGQARAGQGPLVEALKNTDAGFLDLIRSSNSTDQALQRMIARLAATTDPAERARLAAAAFGRTAGIAFGGAADDIQKFSEEAQRLGIVISTSVLQQAAQTDRAFKQLSATIRSDLMQSVLAAAPALEYLAKKLREATVGIFQGSSLLQIESLKQDLAGVETEINEIDMALAKLGKRFEAGGVVGPETETAVTTVLNRRIELVKQQAALQAQLEKLQPKAAEVPPPLGPPLATSGADLAGAVSKVSRAAAGPDPLAAAIREFKQLEDMQTKAENASQEFTDRVTTSWMEATGKQVELIRRTEQAQIDSLDRLALTEQEKAELRVKIHETAEARISELTEKSSKTLEHFVESIGGIVGELFADLASGAKINFQSILTDFLRVIITMETRAASSALLKYFESGSQTATPGAGGSSLLGGVLSSAVGWIGSLLHLQHGGIVTMPTLAMLAEGSRPEAVIPLDKLGGIGGGPTNVEIHTHAGQPVNVQQSDDRKTMRIFVGQLIAEDASRNGAGFRTIARTVGAQRQGRRV